MSRCIYTLKNLPFFTRNLSESFSLPFPNEVTVSTRSDACSGVDRFQFIIKDSVFFHETHICKNNIKKLYALFWLTFFEWHVGHAVLHRTAQILYYYCAAITPCLLIHPFLLHYCLIGVKKKKSYDKPALSLCTVRLPLYDTPTQDQVNKSPLRTIIDSVSVVQKLSSCNNRYKARCPRYRSHYCGWWREACPRPCYTTKGTTLRENACFSPPSEPDRLVAKADVISQRSQDRLQGLPRVMVFSLQELQWPTLVRRDFSEEFGSVTLFLPTAAIAPACLEAPNLFLKWRSSERRLAHIILPGPTTSRDNSGTVVRFTLTRPE